MRCLKEFTDLQHKMVDRDEIVEGAFIKWLH